ncbi:MAG: hypothetical protein JO002_01475 [Burkholderiaceae bacterium]|nr:hypothetical protein [Burkholderiaceae bacterium]
MVKMGIPTQEDWGDYSSNFETAYAYEKYFGRSNEEMREAYVYNITPRADDIIAMPRVPFIYYFKGLCDFILSGRYGAERPGMVHHTFSCVIEIRIKESPSVLKEMQKEIDEVLDFFATNQDSLGIDREIYGDLKEYGEATRRLMADL